MQREDNMHNSVIDNAAEERYHGHTKLGLKGVSSAAKGLLTTQEVCKLLKVSKTYIYWLTHQRKIPFIKMQGHLRFRQSDIEEWLNSQKVEASIVSP